MSKSFNDLIKYYEVSEKHKQEAANILYKKITFGKSPQEKPLSVVIGGQPGAGKSGIMAYYQNKYPEALLFDIDDFRFYHPFFKDILKNHPDEMVSLTAKFISDLSANLTSRIIKDGYSAIFHKTMANEAVIYDTIIPLKENGYDVSVCGIAVNKMESKMSAFERTIEEHRNLGWWRWAAKGHHDRAYSGMLSTIDLIEKNGYADNVKVFRRGEIIEEPSLIYASSCNQRAIDSEVFNPFGYKSAMDAIEKARADHAYEIAKQIPSRLANLDVKDEQAQPYISELLELASKYLDPSQSNIDLVSHSNNDDIE